MDHKHLIFTQIFGKKKVRNLNCSKDIWVLLQIFRYKKVSKTYNLKKIKTLAFSSQSRKHIREHECPSLHFIPPTAHRCHNSSPLRYTELLNTQLWNGSLRLSYEYDLTKISETYVKGNSHCKNYNGSCGTNHIVRPDIL